MHEDSMKKLQGDCIYWLVLLTGATQLLLVCGEGMLTYHCQLLLNVHICIQECTYLWDQPSSPLTTLRSSSLILEMMLEMVVPLSSVTLTSWFVVDPVRQWQEELDIGTIQMGIVFLVDLPHHFDRLYQQEIFNSLN